MVEPLPWSKERSSEKILKLKEAFMAEKSQELKILFIIYNLIEIKNLNCLFSKKKSYSRFLQVFFCEYDAKNDENY